MGPYRWATIVFGFALGRFFIALQEFLHVQGKSVTTPGVTAWLGLISILGGIAPILSGLVRYRKTRVMIKTGAFQPAGFVVDMVAVLLALFGLALAVYLHLDQGRASVRLSHGK